MSKELDRKIKEVCNLCAKEGYMFDMKFTYQPGWTDKDYCYPENFGE